MNDRLGEQGQRIKVDEKDDTHPYTPDGWTCTVSPGKSDRPRSSLPAGCLEAINAEVGDKLQVTVDETTIKVTRETTQMKLIQCTRSKRSVSTKAKHLYDESDYFVKMRRYVNAKGGAYKILSAKHGLVDPDEVIEPYDEFGLSEHQAKEIADELVSIGVDEVEIIAGRKYTNPLIPELEKQGIDVTETCAGLKIGKRKQRLKEKINKLENQQL